MDVLIEIDFYYQRMREIRIGAVEISAHSCGPMNIICQFCGAFNFKDEKTANGKFKNCCHKGIVIINTSLNKDYIPKITLE